MGSKIAIFGQIEVRDVTYRVFLYQGTEDLAAFLNPEQPLIMSTAVSQSCIDQQEAIVKETRMKLAEAIEALLG